MANSKGVDISKGSEDLVNVCFHVNHRNILPLLGEMTANSIDGFRNIFEYQIEK